MKLLLVIDSFGMGGAERSTASTIPFIVRAGIDLQIVVFAVYDHGYLDEVRSHGVVIHELIGGATFSRVTRLRQVIANFRPDVLHSVLLQSNLRCRLARRGFHLTYVESLVNKSYAKQRSFSSLSFRIKHQLIKWVDRLTLSAVDHFHAVGESVSKHYQDVMGLSSDKITVIHRGRGVANPSQERDTMRRSLGISNDTIMILAVGRQEHQKGFNDIVDAANQINANFKVFIAGREGQATDGLVKQIADAGVNDRIILLGYRDDAANLYHAADIYISTSHFEGLPGSALEAMSAGLPLLLRSIGENEEVATDAEALFFTNQPDLATKLKQLIFDESLRHKLGTSSLNRFDRHFRIDRKAEEMVKFYFTMSKRKG